MTHPYDNLPPVRIECFADDAFAAWIAQIGGSLLASTYQSGKVAAIGWDGRQVSLLMREFEKPMGLAIQGNRLALATRHDVTFFANDPFLAPAYDESRPGRYDALFLPRPPTTRGTSIPTTSYSRAIVWLSSTHDSPACRV